MSQKLTRRQTIIARLIVQACALIPVAPLVLVLVLLHAPTWAWVGLGYLLWDHAETRILDRVGL